jgi:membrane protease YdiL (CAAX protease family)
MPEHRSRDWTALVFAMAFPSVVTVVYFVMLAGHDSALQHSAYVLGKSVQFGFPAVWVFLVLRERFQVLRPGWQGVRTGLFFGLVVSVVMLLLYHLVLKPQGVFNSPNETVVTTEAGQVGGTTTGHPTPADSISSKIRGFGVDCLWKYIALGTFYSVCHSFLEEYYWRWFVFRRLRLLTPLASAAVVSGLAFTAHHVIVLATYFGGGSPWTYFFSACVAVGGALWAWLYERTGSLYGPWLSHLVVDVAVFVVGYDMARHLFA